MSQVLSLQLSDDEYQAVERAAKPTGQEPAEWAAMKLRQQLFAAQKGSPAKVLQAMREPPHLTSQDVSTLEDVIERGKLRVEWEPAFTSSIS